MSGGRDRAHVRLAELVAALSLGVDLGFGQPITALLINVGCHSDAHEQAKWFGDDIAAKSGKYGPHDARGLRAVAAMVRRLGAGNPPLHRLRVGLDFVTSGHRDVDGMMARHAGLAAGLAEQLGLPQALPARIAQFAEYVEVAHRLDVVDVNAVGADVLGFGRFGGHGARLSVG